MKFSKEQLVQSKFDFAIVDEVDSILIDEARHPCYIWSAETSSDLYNVVDKIISKLNPTDYEKDEKSKLWFSKMTLLKNLRKYLEAISYYRRKSL